MITYYLSDVEREKFVVSEAEFETFEHFVFFKALMDFTLRKDLDALDKYPYSNLTFEQIYYESEVLSLKKKEMLNDHLLYLLAAKEN